MPAFERALWRIVDAVLFVAVVGMVCLITLQVVSRLAGSSVAWTEELSRFLFIWTAWLGMAAGFRQGQHPSLSVLSAILPRRTLWVLRLLPPICAAIFFAVVCWFGIELVSQQVRFGEISPILQVGMWITTVPLVLGSALAILGAIMHAILVDPYHFPETTEEGATI